MAWRLSPSSLSVPPEQGQGPGIILAQGEGLVETGPRRFELPYLAQGRTPAQEGLEEVAAQGDARL